MAVIYDEEKKRYYGVAEAAREIGVTTSHLAQCLKGNRVSKRVSKLVKIKVVK